MKKTLLLVSLFSLFLITKAQQNIDSLSFLSYSQELNDIWGYVDSEGNEYALVGTATGLSIVDVTTPTAPVEVFFGSGINSIWRDIKTWGDYAYVCTEGGGGIYIVDLSPLPGTITTTSSFTGSVYPFQTVHNLYIDEFGKLYIFGSNNGSGGAIICDLTADPMNPVELGRFDDFYLHDGMARGDTLWGGAIYNGKLAAIDVSDPASPQLMATKSTPNQFTHNCWVSDDGNTVFTTDEEENAFVTAYDVTDFNNITELDRVQSSPGNNVIPHNVHVNNEYLVTSYYSDGVVIHDADRPANLIEVGNYDTAPDFPGPGYHGSWGVYPFLPSGIIVAADIENGLYVLQPNYVRGCYLEGNVTDSITGLPVNNVKIEVVPSGISDYSDFSGDYAFGTAVAGTYDVVFSNSGYNTKTIEDVVLDNGLLTTLNVELSSWFTGIGDKSETYSLKSYPNPFTNSTTLDYHINGGVAGDALIQVFSVNGSLLYEAAIYENDGSVSIGAKLEVGIYYVRLKNKGYFGKPIMIQKIR
ncbi:MAG: choice-of-anchor B family protein [Chlorobi bacterium]|nr:choice-of-anchor B family protein [Chlorobiota bacterium]